MSDDSIKKDGQQDIRQKLGGPSSRGPLPGLGGQTSKAPLPGLGRPSKAPLPGLGQPSKSPLPGMGAKPMGAPLPGVGGPQVAVPPFMQQPSQQPAPAPQISRDPFGRGPAPAPVGGVLPSSVPRAVSSVPAELPSTPFNEASVGTAKRSIIIGAIVIVIAGLAIGYFMGSGKSRRVSLNATITDALIIEYEVKKAATLFNEIQTVISAALAKGSKREYDKTHITFILDRLKDNPIPSTIFTDRNYKSFPPATINWLMDYYQSWAKLYKLISIHKARTKADEPALTAAAAELEKLLKANYGVVFTRNEQMDNQFMANVVVFATVPGKEGVAKVQLDTGNATAERKIYNPEAGDAELTKNPDEYVVLIGDDSKAGLLKNATQSQFQKYLDRLQEISDLTKNMGELQANLLQKLSVVCSEDPVFLGGADPLEEFEAYKARGASASAKPEK